MNLTNLTPDQNPTYKVVPDPWWARLIGLKLGRWSVNGKVYPVRRPKLGKIVKLDQCPKHGWHRSICLCETDSHQTSKR